MAPAREIGSPVMTLEELLALVEAAGGDLSALSGEELAELRTQLQAGYAEYRPTVENDEQVEALRTVVEALAAVDAQVEVREAAAAEREAQLAEMDAAVAAAGEGGEGEAGDGDAGDGEAGAEGEGDGAGSEGAEGAEGGAGEAGGEAGDGSGGGGDAGTGATAAGDAGDGEQRRAASATGRRPPLSVLNQSQQRRTASSSDEPREGELRLAGRIVAATNTPTRGRGAEYETVEELGADIARLASDLQVQGTPSGTKHYLGRRSVLDRSRAVLQSEFGPGIDDTAILDAAVAKTRAARDADNRKVASGGVCVPAMPDYTLTTVGERGNAWVDGLPTVTGNRPMAWFPWILMSLNATPGSRVGARPSAGIGTVTEPQDAAGYGSGGGQHAPKDCVRIDCPTLGDPLMPEATFQCTTIGNFTNITFPEYVRVFDETVGFYFDVHRDELALSKFVSHAKKLHIAGPTFGATRDLLDALRRHAAHIRSVRKAPNLAINYDLPMFARYMLASDIADSWSDGTENLRVTPQQALAMLAIDEGIVIGEYSVSIGNTGNGTPTVLPELADGDHIPDWVTEIRVLAYPDGAVFRHDFGELAFGLRETGMSTNDFSAFMETFENVGFRTTDLWTIDVPLCVNGAQGAVVAKTCAAVGS